MIFRQNRVAMPCSALSCLLFVFSACLRGQLPSALQVSAVVLTGDLIFGKLWNQRPLSRQERVRVGKCWASGSFISSTSPSPPGHHEVVVSRKERGEFSRQQHGDNPREEDTVEGAGPADRSHRRPEARQHADIDQIGPNERPQRPRDIGQRGGIDRDSASATVAAINGGTKIGTLMPIPATGCARKWTTAVTTITPTTARA